MGCGRLSDELPVLPNIGRPLPLLFFLRSLFGFLSLRIVVVTVVVGHNGGEVASLGSMGDS